jgi:hypothetical protein
MKRDSNFDPLREYIYIYNAISDHTID